MAQVARVEQRDGERRGLDHRRSDAWPRHRRLGLAPALDVEQRERELAPDAAAGRDRVADDPELAPVARAHPALEGLGLALDELSR